MSGPRWLDTEQQQAWRAYLLGTARVTEALNRQLEADSGVSLSEYEILVRLSEAPGRTIRMSELARSVMHSRSRLTHTVSRMERRGLVRRQACAEDGRGVNCAMTPQGYALLVEAAPGHVEAVRTNLVDLLAADDVHVLGRIMARVAEGPEGREGTVGADCGEPAEDGPAG